MIRHVCLLVGWFVRLFVTLVVVSCKEGLYKFDFHEIRHRCLASVSNVTINF